MLVPCCLSPSRRQVTYTGHTGPIHSAAQNAKLQPPTRNGIGFGITANTVCTDGSKMPQPVRMRWSFTSAAHAPGPDTVSRMKSLAGTHHGSKTCSIPAAQAISLRVNPPTLPYHRTLRAVNPPLTQQSGRPDCSVAELSHRRHRRHRVIGVIGVHDVFGVY